MDIEKRQKLQILHGAWPKDAVLTTAGLKAHGFSDQLIQKYCHSGWLNRLGVGGFVRQSDKATWQGGLYAIQHDLKKFIHLGGLSVLEMRGLAHYLRPSEEKMIYLYNTTSTRDRLPGWFIKYFDPKKIHYTQCHLFDKEIGIESQFIEGLEIIISQPERAILEALYLVPKYLSIEHAGHLVENLQTIRPDLMQSLLENCRHIVVKRLFLCLADLAQLPVCNHLHTERIELGSGDRTILPRGRYFSKYKLVFPYDNRNESEQDVGV